MNDLVFTPEILWDELISELSARWTDQNFVSRYNNDRDQYRSRNCRPRTDVMLKDKNSVLDMTMHNLRKRGGIGEGGIGKDRYMDFLFAMGDWWTGCKKYYLAVEVENNWPELRGTLLDLFRFQAMMKMAIFYSSDKNSIIELNRAATEAANNFSIQGFQESNQTNYLLVILPDRNTTPTKDEAQAIAFTGLDSITNTVQFRSPLPR